MRARGWLGRRAALEALDAPGAPAEGRDALERGQARAVAGLRRRIRAGRAPRAVLSAAFARLAAADPGFYGSLDGLLAALPGLPPPAPPASAPHPEHVGYQPSPAAGLLRLCERAGLAPGRRVLDLGSGLGTAALALHLFSGAEVAGLELEPAYVDYARRAAAALGLEAGLRYDAVDLADAPLTGADLYYLYTPLRGARLERLLGRLRAAVRGRRAQIAALGPCASALAAQDWLRPADAAPPGDDVIRLFDAHPA